MSAARRAVASRRRATWPRTSCARRRPRVSAPATIGSSSGEPGTCAQVGDAGRRRDPGSAPGSARAPGSRGWSPGRSPVRANGVNTSPARVARVERSALASPMSEMPRATSAIPVTVRPPTRSKRGGDRDRAPVEERQVGGRAAVAVNAPLIRDRRPPAPSRPAAASAATTAAARQRSHRIVTAPVPTPDPGGRRACPCLHRRAPPACRVAIDALAATSSASHAQLAARAAAQADRERRAAACAARPTRRPSRLRRKRAIAARVAERRHLHHASASPCAARDRTRTSGGCPSRYAGGAGDARRTELSASR